LSELKILDLTDSKKQERNIYQFMIMNHDRDLKRWAIQQSRKINQRLNIQKSLAELRVSVNNKLENYEKREVVNFDQMGINHEIYSKRTLSHCGEK
jgi:hypothetical protein